MKDWKTYLNNTIEFMNDLYEKYSIKPTIDNDFYSETKYSKTNKFDIDQCLSCYFRIKDYNLPRLYVTNPFKSKNHTELFFDKNNELLRKTVYYIKDNNLIYDYFYVNNSDLKLRLKFRDNSLIEIHSCTFTNGLITEINNACYDNYGSLERLSGERYVYVSGRISTCIKYTDYFPCFPMFSTGSDEEMTVTVNPTITEYNLLYDNNELFQYTSSFSNKKIDVQKSAVYYFNKINAQIDLEQIAVW